MTSRYGKADVPGLPGIDGGAADEDRRRMERLRRRKNELESRLGALDRRAIDRRKIQTLEREVAELASEQDN